MMGNTPKNQTMTTYFKNGKMRVESMGSIILMDPKSKKNIILNPTDKTYSELGMDMMTPEQKKAMKNMKMTMSAHLKPTTQTKMIAGKKAQKYIITMVMHMQLPGQTPTAPSMGAMDMNMDMEQWTTTALKDHYSPQMMMQNAGQMLKQLSMMGDTSSMMKEFAKMKGFPLDNNMTMKMTMKPAKGSPQAGQAPMSFDMTMQTNVDSISEAPLNGSLFVIPAGYKKSSKTVNMGNLGRGRG